MKSKSMTSHVNLNFINFYYKLIFFLITTFILNDAFGQNSNVFTFDCGDQQRVDTYGQGANLCNTSPDALVNIPTPSNVYQAVVEVVYKNENQGTTVQVSSNLGNYTLNEVQVTGGSSNVRVYRGTITGNVTTVSVNDNNNSCGDGDGLQSLLVYAYRNINSGSSQSGVFTEKSGYCDQQSLTIPISTDIGSRNLVLSVPISELTNDGRYMTIRATAGSTANSVTINGPNTSLGTCCLNIVSLPLNNVAGNTSSITLEILTDRANNPANNNQCGQSYVLAGIVTATVACTSDCEYGDAPSSYGTIGFDYGCGIIVKMGTLIDADNAMQSNTNANGDDNDGIDDEDGVTFVGGSTFTKGLQKSITVNYTSGYPTAYINGWIDWNGDGDFNDTGERIITNSSVSGSGNRTFNITPPAISKCGTSYARITISANENQGPTGNFCSQSGCNDGEVEDYIITINEGMNVSVGSNFEICSASQVTLTASVTPTNQGPFSYLWSGGGTGSSKNYNVVSTSTYTVTVSDAGGCTASSSVRVTVLPSFTATADKTGDISCTTPNPQVRAFPTGMTYQWSGPAGFSSTSRTPTVSSAGTYTVIVTNSNDCTASAQVTVNANNTNPNANITGTNTVCNGTNATFTASGAGTGGSYLWSTTATTAAITVSTAGTYTVTVTNANGCTDTATRTLTVNNNPNANITGTNTVCNGRNTTFTASGAGTGGSYLWSTTATTAAITVSTAGTYTVTVTNANGCTDTATRTLTVNNNPNANITGTNTVCNGRNTTFTASGAGTGGSYLWSTTATTAAITVSTAGTYTVTVTNANGCTDTATRTLTVNNNPNANITGTNTVCNGTNATFTASGAGTGGSYLWSTTATTTAITVSTAGTYTVTVTNANGCTDTATRTLTVNNNPNANITGTNTVCNGRNTTFTASGAGTGGSYLWSTTATTAAITVSTAGTYTVTVTNANGCTDTATRTLTVNNNPNANITGTNTVCNGRNTTFTASGAGTGGSYLWSTTATTAAITVSTAGTYTVTVTNANGCTDTATRTLTVNNNPNANITGTNTVCNGRNTTFTASGAGTGGSYLWSTTATTAAITVSTAGTYTVTVTNANGCTDTATRTLTVNNNPNANITGTNTVCNGTNATFTASGAGTGGSYLWSTTATTAAITVSTAGTYTVTVTNANGCTDTATRTLTVNNNPNANITGTNTVCNGTNATFTASGAGTGGSYLWSTTATTAAITVSTAGTYTVTVTNANGCTDTATRTLTVNNNPNASISKSGNISCILPNSTLTAFPESGMNYLWSVNNLTTRIITVNSGGTYTVTVTNSATGCFSVRDVVVDQNTTIPNANAGSDKTLTCTTTSVVLTGSSTTTGVSYTWAPSNGGNIVSGGNTATPTIKSAGTYTLTVTNNLNGCTATDFAQVTLNNTPPANVSADNIGGPLTCIDNSVTIRAFPNVSTYTYSWSGPNGYTSTSRTNNVSVTGTYRVTVTDTQNGCTASSSTNVTQDTDIPTANAGGNKTICNGTSTTLTATGNGTYRWSTNATTASITVNPVITTTYTVTVTGANGCTNSAQAIVTVTPLPSSGLTGPNEICVDEYAVFNASPVVSGATYAWTFDGGTSLDGDANDPTESIKWASTYQNTSRTVTLTVTKDNCSNTYTKAILVKAGVYLNTQANYPVCEGGTVQIGPNPNDANQVSPGATFQWTPNLFLNSNTVARPLSTPPFDIVYTLTATLNGCAVSRQITVDVNVNLNPIADAGQDKTVCLGNSVQIGGTLQRPHPQERQYRESSGQYHQAVLSAAHNKTH
ncbi:MAG: hypothetical protein IPK35_17320 [Saprospiraceae bacterium]|nr:hypothetical protein [Saprospiraceae bacterium]